MNTYYETIQNKLTPKCPNAAPTTFTKEVTMGVLSEEMSQVFLEICPFAAIYRPIAMQHHNGKIFSPVCC